MSAELLSWRPRVPEAIYHSQNLGETIHPTGEDQVIVEKVLKDMPFWDHYEFVQDSASHFSIKKGTGQENCCLIDCLHGNRSNGGVSFGSEHGSVLFAIRDFWEKYCVCNLLNIEGSIPGRTTNDPKRYIATNAMVMRIR